MTDTADKERAVEFTCFDFNKAFDTISHNLFSLALKVDDKVGGKPAGLPGSKFHDQWCKAPLIAYQWWGFF